MKRHSTKLSPFVDLPETHRQGSSETTHLIARRSIPAQGEIDRRRSAGVRSTETR